MAALQLSVEAQLQQLGEARNIVLKDPGYWPQVLERTLPIITGPILEVRRWGADFLAETFSTPIVDARAKQELASACLDTVLRLSNETEISILKGVVQCSASVYPMIFRHICTNRNDADTWNKMVAIKSKILSLWDDAPAGVRICCIKFVQRVILIQSRGVTDPRLVDRSEVSLTSVPANHPLLSLSSLDAEAQGLLDRLLSILQDNSEPPLITATINNLSVIVKTRPPLAPKVINAVLSVNPFSAKFLRPVTVHNRLMMISIEKTIRIMLMNIMRNNPQGPFSSRISQHIAKLSQAKAELNESFSRKRGAGSHDTEAIKRPKMERLPATKESVNPALLQPPAPPQPPTAPNPALQEMPPGPVTYAKLFTLATDPALISFDGQQLPLDLVLQIVIGSMYSVDQNNLVAAIAAVQARYNTILQSQPTQPSSPQSVPLVIAPTAPQSPTVGTTTSTELVATKILPPLKKDLEEDVEDEEEIQLQLGEFQLPPPSPLTHLHLQHVSIGAIDRMFVMIDEFEKTSLIARKTKLGVNRLAASNWDREGWIALLIRMATRGSQDDLSIKSEEGRPLGLADNVRERLYNYVIRDFRKRMDIAVAWLNEEWYNDRVLVNTEEGSHRQPQYHKWIMKLMDAIFPFLESRDRLFMRMLSETPEFPPELLEKIKMLCLDPDRTALGIQILHYLAMFRPPVRELCVDVLEDLWQNHTEVRNQVQKLVHRWRPSVLERAAASHDEMAVVNGDGTSISAAGV